MLTSDRNRWRYPGDSALLESLLAEDAVRGSIETSKLSRQRDSARAKLLAGAVMVEPSLLPHLSAAVERLTARFPEVGVVECFVYSAPEVNAFLTTGRTRTLVAISSAAVNHLDAGELEFILGHELGHALFGHMELAASNLIENGNLLPSSTMRLRAWQRAAEISADRAGLILCGAVQAAAQALFKAASGIVAHGVIASPQRFAAQWQRLLTEVVEEGQRDFWDVSHPFPPLRMQAMLLFWDAWQKNSEADLADVNAAVTKMLAMMDPGACGQTLHDPLLGAFFFWGGLYVALADGELHDGEMRRLESVRPPDLAIDEAIHRGRQQPSACVAAFTDSIRSRRQKLSAIELHRIIYGLIDVASADGHVSDAELERLRELGSALGVPARACDLIVNQYEQEGGRGD